MRKAGELINDYLRESQLANNRGYPIGTGANGVVFESDIPGNVIKQRIGAKIEHLVELNGVQRITSFIEVLNDLATTDDYTLLNANGFAFESTHQDSNKIEVIYKHINENFRFIS